VNRLEKLSTPSSVDLSTPHLAFDFGDRTTYPVAPPVDLLSRVQAFLPQIEASNAHLAQRAETDPDSVNIERIGESMEHYIEMNLGLGVFEDRSHRNKLNTLDKQDPGSSSSDTSSVEENDSDLSDAETDTSSEIVTSFCPAPRLIRPLPRRSVASRLSKPKIQVLTSETVRK